MKYRVVVNGRKNTSGIYICRSNLQAKQETTTIELKFCLSTLGTFLDSRTRPRVSVLNTELSPRIL